MKELKVEAKTVKEAIEKGLRELNLTREQVEVEVIREEKKGILGIGSESACVIIREKSWNIIQETKPQVKSFEITLENNQIKYENPLETTKKIFSEILQLSKIDFKILNEVWNEASSTVYINFQSKDAGLLLYNNAKGLLALQHIISVIINRLSDKKIVVKIDTEEFWDKTENRLKKDVEHAIEFINRTKKPYKMKPMPAVMRKIVHDIVKNQYPNYTTFSIGQGKMRRIVIKKNLNNTTNEPNSTTKEKQEDYKDIEAKNKSEETKQDVQS